MEINDTSYQPGGIFTFAKLCGVTNHLPKGSYKKAMLDEGGADALIHYYLRGGGEQVDAWQAKNRLVQEGLYILVNLLVAGGAALPTRMQLGSGSDGTWASSLTACRTPIVAGTLGEVVADSATQQNGSYTGDTYRVIEDFTAGAIFAAGSAPDEVCIRSATPKALCYATFSERTLAAADHLIVTYNLKLVP